jgi:hypothetical protein
MATNKMQSVQESELARSIDGVLLRPEKGSTHPMDWIDTFFSGASIITKAGEIEVRKP